MFPDPLKQPSGPATNVVGCVANFSRRQRGAFFFVFLGIPSMFLIFCLLRQDQLLKSRLLPQKLPNSDQPEPLHGIPTAAPGLQVDKHEEAKEAVQTSFVDSASTIVEIADSTATAAPAAKSSPIKSSPPSDGIKTSQLHYVIPATSENELFCSVVASLLVNRFPIPFAIGWKGEGKYDAKAAHIAKLRTMQRYLHSLPKGGDDDDLVIYGDGYDVMAQLPADVLIERYFDIVHKADRRLADRYGITVDQLHDQGLRNTLLWGADKMCQPDLKEPQCQSIPPSPLQHQLLGPATYNGRRVYEHPKYLNSGSVIGPLGDLRKFIDEAVREMEATHDTSDKDHQDSDQMYVARVFGIQEKGRSELAEKGIEPVVVDDKQIEKREKDSTEFHITLDYESEFTQTGCFSHEWMAQLEYDSVDHTATISENYFERNEDDFKPYPVQMPANVYQSLARMYSSISEHVEHKTAREFVASLGLWTNVASEVIFSFYHATCSKTDFIEDFAKYWFVPYLKPLMQAAFRSIQAEEPITEKIIDGRKWVYKNQYPDTMVLRDELGGLFTDHKDAKFVPFSTMCRDKVEGLKL